MGGVREWTRWSRSSSGLGMSMWPSKFWNVVLVTPKYSRLASICWTGRLGDLLDVRLKTFLIFLFSEPENDRLSFASACGIKSLTVMSITESSVTWWLEGGVGAAIDDIRLLLSFDLPLLFLNGAKNKDGSCLIDRCWKSCKYLSRASSIVSSGATATGT